MKRRRIRGGARAGFSQVELLVVLACLAILATILLPAFHAAQQQRGRLRSLTALRTFGTGIDQYVDDHDGYLPGPVNGGQGTRYSITSRKNLAYFLWSYLGANPPTAQLQTIPALVDLYREKLGFPTIYLRNGSVPIGDDPNADPFGYPNAPGSSGEPMPIYVIENPSSIWAVRDVSKEDMPGSPGFYSALPPKAIYGAPNALFFDGHVGSLPGGVVIH